MKLASDVFIKEHQLFDQMLENYQKAIDLFQVNKLKNHAIFSQIYNFNSEFIDFYHFAKEENVWFKQLERHSPPDGSGPVPHMLNEHVWCRRYNTNVGEAIDLFNTDPTSAKIALLENGQSYIELLTNHTYKEESIVFKMGNQIFSEDVQKQILSDLLAFEEEEYAGGTYNHFRNIVKSVKIQLAGEGAFGGA